MCMNITQCDLTHLPQGQDQHLLPLCAVLQADTRAQICWQAQHPEATVMNLGGNQDHLLIDAGEPQGLVVVVHRLDVVAGAVRLVPLLLQSLCQHLVFPCCRLFRIELKGIFCLREGGKEGDPLDVLLLGVLIVLPQVWPLLKADLTENLRKLFPRTSRSDINMQGDLLKEGGRSAGHILWSWRRRIVYYGRESCFLLQTQVPPATQVTHVCITLLF